MPPNPIITIWPISSLSLIFDIYTSIGSAEGTGEGAGVAVGGGEAEGAGDGGYEITAEGEAQPQAESVKTIQTIAAITLNFFKAESSFIIYIAIFAVSVYFEAVARYMESLFAVEFYIIYGASLKIP